MQEDTCLSGMRTTSDNRQHLDLVALLLRMVVIVMRWAERGFSRADAPPILVCCVLVHIARWTTLIL